MSEKHVASTDPALYDPATSIDAIDPMEQFDKADFADYIYARFQASEKIYEPLKDWLATYRIETEHILGTDFPATENTQQLFNFEQAKLLVLARMMSKKNKKWRSIVSHSKPSMSAVFSSSAPSSLAHREKIELYREYILLLKDGMPAECLDSAKPLLENAQGCEYEGGLFDMMVRNMGTITANYITARQREFVVESNERHGRFTDARGYKFWPSEVSPAFGAAEATHEAGDRFLDYMESVPPDANKDLARTRLLKDFFLDSESSFWAETQQLNRGIQDDLPHELMSMSLLMAENEISERVAQAFNIHTSELPPDLLEEAKCLIWLYGLKHCPTSWDTIEEDRDKYFKGNLTPDYIAVAAVILYRSRLACDKVKITVPGETYGTVPVYKAFKQALKNAGVVVGSGVEANKAKLSVAFRDIDTKVMTYMATLFSISTHAIDDKTHTMRMEYALHQIYVRAKRTALLAEMPKMLKAHSCRTAWNLICSFSNEIMKLTHNPLTEDV